MTSDPQLEPDDEAGGVSDADVEEDLAAQRAPGRQEPEAVAPPGAGMAHATRPGPTPEEVLPELHRRIGQLPDADTAALVRAFADAAYRRANRDSLARVRADPDGAVAWLVDAVEFMRSREPGQLALRVRDRAHGTEVETTSEDSPFLVSTVLEELRDLGEEVAEVLHPVLGAERSEGRLTRLCPARQATRRESFIWARLARRLPSEQRQRVRERLESVLADARAATRDFEAMTARARAVASELRHRRVARWDPDWVEEVATLLEWLMDDHFVWLGARDYELVEHDGRQAIVAREGSGLGILADLSQSTFHEPVPLDDLPREVSIGLLSDELLTVSRTNRRSTVHKRVRMISLGIKEIDAHGDVLGEHRFLGLFAQRAYAEPASSIPVLRRKLERILETEDVVAHSHDERALRTLFEAFPKHELLALDTERLRATIVELLETQRQQRVRLWCRTEPGGRGVVAVMTVPRERFNARLRRRVQQLLTERFGAEEVDYTLSLAEGDAALLHFVLHVDPRAIERVDVEQMERDVVELTKTWGDALAALLRDRPDGEALAERWSGAFDEIYQAATSPEDAAEDIAVLEAVRTGDEGVALRLLATGDPRVPLRARLVKRGAEVELSAFVPVLESLGLVVVEQVPHYAELPDTRLQLHDFGVRPETSRPVDLEADAERLADAVVAIWHGRAEADRLNRLVVDASLTWQDVAVLRTYRRYRRQVGTAYTEAYQDEAITSRPDVAAALVRLFRARVDPRTDGSDEALQAARTELEEALEQVDHLDADRILRRLAGSVEATVRSNVAVAADRGSEALAIKLDSGGVPEVPAPVPHAEIFVAHPTMEGIHLRGGRIARGGIRASDRREDFRSEVLGLLKAQMPKNSVIVPTGAKGGFVLRNPPADPADKREATTAAYRMYVRALLDVTDDESEPPPKVRRRDDHDPYLVVAPDKGTAHLSDEANAISRAYGFWLGDAFASGGSTGYDHKALGVTARGAWVAVQRHFRELGVDVQTEPIRVIGVGDMSGDVFGNGLLQSRAVKLVAAFDHRDVFIDPDPDPAASYAERRRLFELSRSSWQDYDRRQLSSGGGVWSRTSKRVVLSEQVRQLLELDTDVVTPPELIRAVLQTSADLLFLGGIGTFVKASEETHEQVADRANDAIRVDAEQLRVRVIGEGANLGITQRGRIAYARHGGRVNTDAVDNAAGVATSDREVNLKLALDRAIAAGELPPASRQRLLDDMTEEVVAGVLADVDRQAGALSHEVFASVDDLESYDELMARLEHHGQDLAASGRLDRELEVLPDAQELARRRQAGAGLSRPELAVLLGYAKMDLRHRLDASPLPDDGALEEVVAAYFPPPAREAAPKGIADHPLRRRLVAARVAGDVLDRMGITWVDRLVRHLGLEPHEVVAAYWIARTLLDADTAWRTLEANELLCEPVLIRQLRELVDGAVDAAARSVLRLGVGDIRSTCERDRGAVGAIQGIVDEIGSDHHRAQRDAQVRRYVDLGMEEKDVRRLVLLPDLAIAPDVAELTRRLARPYRTVADAYLRVGDALPFHRLAELLARATPRGLWERWQQAGLQDELQQSRRGVTSRVLRDHPERDAAGAVASFLSARPRERERIGELLERLDRADEPELDGLAVAVRLLRESFAD